MTGRKDAERFWNGYDIPFEFDTAIKGRLSGLSRGSWGDGRDRRSVTHLYVEEAFEDGRLSREAGTFLCGSGASRPMTDERFVDDEGEKYMPPVTCSTCLERMQRWETGGES